jgi:hypothetical protein
MKNYRGLFFYINLFTLCLPLTNAQNHDLDFKVRELTNGTGANIQNVKVDIDNGSYIGFTDANGVAHIHDIPDGTHNITVSKAGYIQFTQDGYTLSSNQIFNASIIKKNQDGPWGNVDFNVSWWRQTFKYVGATMGNQENPQWKQIAPIFNRISPVPAYTQADSLGIVAAINEIETKTGYDLITLVPNTASPDTTYTIKTHSSNGSNIGIDENGIITTGSSGISVTSPTKRVIHEIVTQFGMKPINHLAYPSVMEPSVADIIDMQTWDANNLAVAIAQLYAIQRGEQDLRTGNMLEYVIPVTPGATTNTLPIDNTTGLDNIVRVMWTNISGTDKYHVDIATDILFNNIVQDLMVYRSDTTLTLNPNQQYFMRVQDINSAGNSAWSTSTTFTTAGIVLPGTTSITTPITTATKVAIPVQYILTPSTNATLYEIVVATDAAFSSVIKDTLVSNLNPTIPLSNNITVYTKARGKNANGNGDWTSTTTYTTIKAKPGITGITGPTNNQTKVSIPVQYTLNAATNTETYEIIIATDAAFTNILKDTTLTNLNPTIPIGNGIQVYTKARAKNSDQTGDWTSVINFTTIDIITRILEINAKTSFYAYPNPFNDFITLKTSDTRSTNFKIYLFSSEGRLIRSLTIPRDEKINLSDIRPGSYLIRISSTNISGLSETLTIIKQ